MHLNQSVWAKGIGWSVALSIFGGFHSLKSSITTIAFSLKPVLPDAIDSRYLWAADGNNCPLITTYTFLSFVDWIFFIASYRSTRFSIVFDLYTVYPYFDPYAHQVTYKYRHIHRRHTMVSMLDKRIVPTEVVSILKRFLILLELSKKKLYLKGS